MKKNIGLKIAHEPLPHHLKEIVGGDVIVMGWVHMNFKSTIFFVGGHLTPVPLSRISQTISKKEKEEIFVYNQSNLSISISVQTSWFPLFDEHTKQSEFNGDVCPFAL